MLIMKNGIIFFFLLYATFAFKQMNEVQNENVIHSKGGKLLFEKETKKKTKTV